MKIKKNASICLMFILMTSCKSSNQVSYFQDIDKQTHEFSSRNTNYEVKICPDDQLAISVSSIEPEAVAVFNINTEGRSTYLVDNLGYIDFPVLGKLQVAGKNRRELVDLLTEKISSYVKSPIISVQIKNFKVSVLGEVNKPGSVVLENERVTILDAIGLAGDLNIFGERSNIIVIRESDGKREYHRIDLTSSSVFDSPYYYLQQNDVVYVEPNKARRGNSKYSQNAQFNISVASTIVSAISVIASLTIALLVK